MTSTAGETIVCVLTRDPGGRLTGRINVLRTMITSLLELGHRVEAVVIDTTTDDWSATAHANYRVTRLDPMGLRELGSAVGRAALSRRTTFNESLYGSERLRRSVGQLAREVGADLLIADTVRTAPLVEHLGVRWIVDLDDLYSRRFERALPDDTTGALGYYGERLPAPILPVAELVARRLFGVEAKRLRRREIELARTADAVSLVAEREATELQDRAGTAVHQLPMSVATSTVTARRDGPVSGVFLGQLDYRPNAEALRWYASEVVPTLADHGLEDFVLHVIGGGSPTLQQTIESPHLRFHGYVEDLSAALAEHRVFIAPLLSSTGVPTKILDAFAVGLPVITMTEASAGVGAAPGVSCIEANDAQATARAIRWCVDNPSDAAAIGEAGRRLLDDRFSPDAARRRWAAVIDQVVSVPVSNTRPEESMMTA